MPISRRDFLYTSAAAAALVGMPLRAAAQSSDPKVLKVALYTDMVGYDPIVTTSNIAAYHGAMVYDMLFGNDEKQVPQPQMAEGHKVSDDKLTWTITLREGLAFSDGSPVTTADVIPSIRRWQARASQNGKLLEAATRELVAVDERTFEFRLKEPFPMLPAMLGSPATPLCFIMRKREAEMDPAKAIDVCIGSGPYILNLNETRPGIDYVYDRNPNYRPREDATSGLAGGKQAFFEKVIFANMPDAQTAIAALQAGEIDFYEIPPIDLLPALQGDSNITVADVMKSGTEGSIIINWLQPPFDKLEVRQALLHAIDQTAVLQGLFGDPNWFKAHPSWFTYNCPLYNETNSDWFKTAPDPEKAKTLLAEAGYDGKPIVILQATDRQVNADAVTIIAQQMRAAGFNVQIEAIDWATLLQRRTNKGPVGDGGWNLFVSTFNGFINSNPYTFGHMATIGEKGWFGWPSDTRNEELRAAWMKAETPEEQKTIAEQIQDNAWNITPRVSYGHWVQPVAYRSNLSGFVSVPGVLPLWNVKRT
jgi:peptide/nickel transport system substrate-binding protein